MYLSFIKPLLDTFVSLVLLVIFFPLFIVIGLLIKFDSPGPIFFRQTRIGKDFKDFRIYKFRTMIVNNSIDQYTSSNDTRITKVGLFLRKSSLDELPQLINVVKGQMSLIGPRPSIHKEVMDYGGEHNFKKRLIVKPGITGLHQSTFRSKATIRQKWLLDCYYCRRCSPSLDIKIILLTIKTVLLRSSSSN